MILSSLRCLAIACSLWLAGCASTPPAKLFFVGQDLEAVRGYRTARCCARPDGATAYATLYHLLDPSRKFGGLGVDANMKPLTVEADWGAGTSSAWRTAMEGNAPRLAIGLSLTEEGASGGLKQIGEGRFDPEIRHLAGFIRKVREPVFLRVGYEFDGVWNQAYEDRAAYIAAWRRIVDLIRREGADNAVFVWQGSASPIDDLIERRHEDPADWYPGDRYVDWVALSWFLSPDERPVVPHAYPPPTARELANEIVEFGRAHGKPVMIAELAPQGFDLTRLTKSNISPIWDGPAGGGVEQLRAVDIWNRWYSPMFAFLDEHRDVVDAIAYIDADWDRQPMWGTPYSNGYWGDTRIQANAEIVRRWNKAITRWRGHARPSGD